MIVDCALYRAGRRREGSGDVPADLAAARARRDAFVWIGLHEPTAAELDRVTRDFGLHPLAVEDALKARQRPKLELYDGTLFLVLKPVRYETGTDTVTAGELMLFVGDSFVVTVRHGVSDPPAAVRQRLEEDPELLQYGPAAVLYAMSDTVVDQYLEVAAELLTDLDELEADVFLPDGRTGDRGGRTARIYAFKRQLLEFRRATAPLADPMARLAGAGVPGVDRDVQPFFRDVSDHLVRANEQVEALDRLLSDILDAYLTQLGVQQNDDIRRISAWAAMAAVPTMIAGIYGMNFEHLPELNRVWGYPAVLTVMAVAVFGLYRFFRRRGWL